MRTKFILFLFLFSRLVYSQVTIGAIEKKEEKIVLKPPPYDSLKNFEDQYPSFIDYRQYIGLQVYLPPSFSSDVFASGKLAEQERHESWRDRNDGSCEAWLSMPII